MKETVEFRYTRRRYGTTTYTWVEAQIGGEWVSLGDPWPAVTPKRREMLAEVQRVMAAKRGEREQ